MAINALSNFVLINNIDYFSDGIANLSSLTPELKKGFMEINDSIENLTMLVQQNKNDENVKASAGRPIAKQRKSKVNTVQKGNGQVDQTPTRPATVGSVAP